MYFADLRPHFLNAVRAEFFLCLAIAKSFDAEVNQNFDVLAAAILEVLSLAHAPITMCAATMTVVSRLISTSSRVRCG